MKTLPRVLLIFAVMIALLGCAEKTPRDLIGGTEADAVAMMGPPDERSEWIMSEPGFGPKPSGLPHGTKYLSLFYRDFRGEQWYIMLATAGDYAAVRGKNPGTAAWYVLDVANFPKGAVF